MNDFTPSPRQAIPMTPPPRRNHSCGRVVSGSSRNARNQVDSLTAGGSTTLFYRADDFPTLFGQDHASTRRVGLMSGSRRLISNEHVLARRDHAAGHEHSAGACSCEANTPSASATIRKYLHACRENFVLEVSKHGMSSATSSPTSISSMNVPVATTGELAIVDGLSNPATMSELTAEMDVLCVISNCRRSTIPWQRLQPHADPRADLGKDA